MGNKRDDNQIPAEVWQQKFDKFNVAPLARDVNKKPEPPLSFEAKKIEYKKLLAEHEEHLKDGWDESDWAGEHNGVSWVDKQDSDLKAESEQEWAKYDELLADWEEGQQQFEQEPPTTPSSTSSLFSSRSISPISVDEIDLSVTSTPSPLIMTAADFYDELEEIDDNDEYVQRVSSRIEELEEYIKALMIKLSGFDAENLTLLELTSIKLREIREQSNQRSDTKKLRQELRTLESQESTNDKNVKETEKQIITLTTELRQLQELKKTFVQTLENTNTQTQIRADEELSPLPSSPMPPPPPPPPSPSSIDIEALSENEVDEDVLEFVVTTGPANELENDRENDIKLPSPPPPLMPPRPPLRAPDVSELDVILKLPEGDEKFQRIGRRILAVRKELMDAGLSLARTKDTEASLLQKIRLLHEKAPKTADNAEEENKRLQSLEGLNVELSANTSKRDLFEENRRALFAELRQLEELAKQNINKADAQSDAEEDLLEFSVSAPKPELKVDISVQPDDQETASQSFGEIERYRNELLPPRGSKMDLLTGQGPGYFVGDISKNVQGLKEFRIKCPQDLPNGVESLLVTERNGALSFATTNPTQIEMVASLAKAQVELLAARKIKSKVDIKFSGLPDKDVISKLLSTQPVPRLNSITYLEISLDGSKSEIVLDTNEKMDKWLASNALEAYVSAPRPVASVEEILPVSPGAKPPVQFSVPPKDALSRKTKESPKPRGSSGPSKKH